MRHGGRTPQRVLITGMGVVSAAGANVPETLATFAAAIRHVGRITVFETSLDLPAFEVRCALPAAVSAARSRTLLLAGHALTEALADARLAPDFAALRVGVAMGTTVACQLNDLAFYAAWRNCGETPLAPVERYLQGNLAAALAAQTGATGPRVTVANACSSSADAIGVALSWLRAGRCDLVLAGGADELNRVPVCGFRALSVYSPEPCRPFDRDRRGLNLGEGAAVLVLETEDSARRRGVTAAVELSGYGAACDAHHLTAPRPDGSGLEEAIRRSLLDAGVTPADIDFTNAHGTATHDNDLVEAGTLARLFGAEARVLSTKGYTGHTLGAAGALEAAFAALALREGWLPPSAGFAQCDPDLALGALTQRTAVRGRHALSTSLAFGGNNAALVLSRHGA